MHKKSSNVREENQKSPIIGSPQKRDEIKAKLLTGLPTLQMGAYGIWVLLGAFGRRRNIKEDG